MAAFKHLFTKTAQTIQPPKPEDVISKQHIVIPSAPIRIGGKYFSLSSHVAPNNQIKYSLAQQGFEKPNIGTLYFAKPSAASISLVQSTQAEQIKQALATCSIIHEQIKNLTPKIVQARDNHASKAVQKNLAKTAELYYHQLFTLFANHEGLSLEFASINEGYSRINEINLANKKRAEANVKIMTGAISASTTQNTILSIVTHGALTPLLALNAAQGAQLSRLKIKSEQSNQKLESGLQQHQKLLSGLASLLYQKLDAHEQADLDAFVECSRFFGIIIDKNMASGDEMKQQLDQGLKAADEIYADLLGLEEESNGASTSAASSI